jgi:hypothetical protein
MDKKSDLAMYLRAHTKVRRETKTKAMRRPHRRRDLPQYSLVLSCQGSISSQHSIILGAYQVLEGGRAIRCGLICSDKATDEELDSAHLQISEAPWPGGQTGLRARVVRRDRFVRTDLRHCLLDLDAEVVGFNLPADLAALSVRWSVSRSDRFENGFSLCLREHLVETGHRKEDGFTPRILVKAIDGRRNFIGRTSGCPNRPRGNHQAESGWIPQRTSFLDLRTLTLTLTGDDHNLADAHRRFGLIAHTTSATGPIRDVLDRLRLILELFPVLVGHYRRIGSTLPPSSAYSAASVGKEIMRQARMHMPPIKIHPDLRLTADQMNGLAMAAYYGGRAECRIRRVAVPVVTCDFKSMYLTVMVNMGLCRLLMAKEISAEDATEEARILLEGAEAEGYLRPESWKDLAVLVQVDPQDDLLPTRCHYGTTLHGRPAIGLNYVTSPFNLTYTLADCIAAKIRTGRAPHVIRAIRFRPIGHQRFRKVSICGLLSVDLSKVDLFCSLVESRYRVAKFGESTVVREVLSQFLKTMASSIGYGVFAELNRQENHPTQVDVHCLDTYGTAVANPEEPGDFYMPVMAALITGGARLMLALAEDQATRLGGCYAFMDTDSIAIVATQAGGLVPCPGGSERTEDGSPAIRALSWDQVERIRDAFVDLNPYARDLVPGSILDLEDENFTDDISRDGERVQLWCYSIIAKRYALFNWENGQIRIRKGSRHTLGTYRPPVDPTTGAEVKNWTDKSWLIILERELLGSARGEPVWLRQLAVQALRVSRPAMMGWFEGNPPQPFEVFEHISPAWATRVPKSPDGKPVCLVRRVGQSIWTDMHDPKGPSYRVVVGQRETFDDHTVQGETYEDLLKQHVLRPEPKSSDSSGEPCSRHARGLLGWRHIFIKEIRVIGKEANELELLQAGIVTDEDEYLTEYPRDIRDYLLEILRLIPAKSIQQELNCSRRYSYSLRKGERKPARKYLLKAIGLAGEFARNYLTEHKEPNIPPKDELAIIRMANSLKKSGSK